MKMSNLKNSIKKFCVRVFNVIYQVLWFFGLRRIFLNACWRGGVKKGVAFHSGVVFFDYRRVVVGVGSTINRGCYIDNRGDVSIGDNVNISHDVRIYTAGHNVQDSMASMTYAPVRIENNAWIFPNVIIMPGVVVGEGAVVYPGSVVVKDVEPYGIVGGNPAAFIKKRTGDIEYKLDNRVYFSI